MNPKPSLLIICQTQIRPKMAGPSLRYMEMARALSNRIQVTLAAPLIEDVDSQYFEMVCYGEEPRILIYAAQRADIVLLSGFLLHKYPALGKTKAKKVVDLYDPMPLENLFYHADQTIDHRLAAHASDVEVFNTLLKTGDFFICGSERQRDLWLGSLLANFRLNPIQFNQDPSLRDLIDVVTTGLPTMPPESQPLLRGKHPAVPEDAKIILWGGGIWNWLDPLTLLEGFLQIRDRHPEARLVFLGTRHPNPEVPKHETAAQAVAFAQKSGEIDRTILFFDWISLKEREYLLSESHAGAVTHRGHIETRFSLRTRVFDCFWARLPVLISEGDVASEWVAKYQIGEVVPPGNASSVADALDRLLATPKETYTKRFDPVHERFSWENQIKPLRRFCLSAQTSDDHNFIAKHTNIQMSRLEKILRQKGLRALIKAGWRRITRKR